MEWDPDFTFQLKFTIFWFNRGLIIYLNLYARDFQKKNPLGMFYTLVVQTPQSYNIYLSNKKKYYFVEYGTISMIKWLRMYLLKKNYLEVLFWEIWCIHIQIHPQTSIEPKYDACYLKNKDRVLLQSLLVQLNWRVAPPSGFFTFLKFILHKKLLKKIGTYLILYPY